MKTRLTLLVMTLTACSTVTGLLRENPNDRKWTGACKDLPVFYNEVEIKREFTTACLKDSYESAGVEEAIFQAKKKVCECGADALVVISVAHGTGWSGGAKPGVVVKGIKYNSLESSLGKQPANVSE